MYVRCYFESDWGRLRLATLRLRREIGRALWIDKIVGYLSKLMRKLLKGFLEKLVAWMQRKINEDTISEKESERIWREIEKIVEKNKVNR